ncbi:MAG: hypothetical protein WCL42_08305 [Chlorobiaceae bacterium]
MDNNEPDILDGGGLISFSEICTFCKHWTVEIGRKCKAFPDGIPANIWIGKNDHTKPYSGDNGIQFEAIEPKKTVQ